MPARPGSSRRPALSLAPPARQRAGTGRGRIPRNNAGRDPGRANPQPAVVRLPRWPHQPEIMKSGHACGRACMGAAMIKLKRAYEAATSSDGLRILVERLWPRGLSKPKAKVDLWLKSLAPSTELRKWYGHDPERWPPFRQRYEAELKNHADVLKLL